MISSFREIACLSILTLLLLSVLGPASVSAEVHEDNLPTQPAELETNNVDGWAGVRNVVRFNHITIDDSQASPACVLGALKCFSIQQNFRLTTQGSLVAQNVVIVSQDVLGFYVAWEMQLVDGGNAIECFPNASPLPCLASVSKQVTLPFSIELNSAISADGQLEMYSTLNSNEWSGHYAHKFPPDSHILFQQVGRGAELAIVGPSDSGNSKFGQPTDGTVESFAMLLGGSWVRAYGQPVFSQRDVMLTSETSTNLAFSTDNEGIASFQYSDIPQIPYGWGSGVKINPDFTLASSPSSIALTVGNSAVSKSASIVLTSTLGYDYASVRVSTAWVGLVPSGVTVLFPGGTSQTTTTISSGTGQTQVTVTANPGASTGRSFILGIIASSTSQFVPEGAAHEFFLSVAISIRSATPTLVANLGELGYHQPNGMAIDHNGNIYVALDGSRAIVEIHANGTIEELTGADYPHGLAIDQAGNLYFTSWWGGTIQKLPAGCRPLSSPYPDCVVTLLSGVGLGPRGVGVDSHGNVFFTTQPPPGSQEMNGTLSVLFSNGTVRVLLYNQDHPRFMSVGPDDCAYWGDSPYLTTNTGEAKRYCLGDAAYETLWRDVPYGGSIFQVRRDPLDPNTIYFTKDGNGTLFMLNRTRSQIPSRLVEIGSGTGCSINDVVLDDSGSTLFFDNYLEFQGPCSSTQSAQNGPTSHASLSATSPLLPDAVYALTSLSAPIQGYAATINGVAVVPDPSDIGQGSKIIFTITVQNRGTEDISSAKVQVKITKPGGTTPISSPYKSITSFKAGTERTVNVTYTLSSSAPLGAWTYEVYAYRGSTVLDQVTDQGFTVQSAVKTGEIVSVTADPDPVGRGGTTAFTVIFENTGNIIWSTAKLTAKIHKPGSTTVYATRTLTVSNIAPNIEYTRQVMWTPSSYALLGDYTYDVTLTYGSLVLDSSIGNTVTVEPISKTGEITAIGAAPDPLTPPDTATFSVTVMNTGNTIWSSGKVVIKIHKPLSASVYVTKSLSISNIAPGDLEYTCKINWAVSSYATAGTYTYDVYLTVGSGTPIASSTGYTITIN